MTFYINKLPRNITFPKHSKGNVFSQGDQTVFSKGKIVFKLKN